METAGNNKVRGALIGVGVLQIVANEQSEKKQHEATLPRDLYKYK
jgi:hypothetical protein